MFPKAKDDEHGRRANKHANDPAVAPRIVRSSPFESEKEHNYAGREEEEADEIEGSQGMVEGG